MARLSFSQFATKFEKSWSKARWMTPSEAAAPLPEAVEVFGCAEVRLGAGGAQRRGARLGARQAEHLMARAEKFLDDGGADKARCSGNKNSHTVFPLSVPVGMCM